MIFFIRRPDPGGIGRLHGLIESRKRQILIVSKNHARREQQQRQQTCEQGVPLKETERAFDAIHSEPGSDLPKKLCRSLSLCKFRKAGHGA